MICPTVLFDEIISRHNEIFSGTEEEMLGWEEAWREDPESVLPWMEQEVDLLFSMITVTHGYNPWDDELMEY
jgi:hypothetical protein